MTKYPSSVAGGMADVGGSETRRPRSRYLGACVRVWARIRCRLVATAKSILTYLKSPGVRRNSCVTVAVEEGVEGDKEVIIDWTLAAAICPDSCWHLVGASEWCYITDGLRPETQ